MGGNAAKERRRLKRLAEQGGSEGEKTNTATSTSTSNSKPTLDTKKMSTSKKPKLEQVSKSRINKSFPNVKSFQVSKNRTNGKSPSKIPIKSKPTMTKKKVKKPKHLARKMQFTQDPKELEELEKKQKALESKKKERAEKFKEKVIQMVGGIHNFDEDAFHNIMETGGGKLETIVEASTRKSSDNSNDQTIERELSSTNLHNHDKNLDMNGLNDEKQDDSSSSSSESGDESDEKKTMEPSYESSSSSDSDESSDDEVDGETEKRIRGRRRRGLKDVDSKRDELNRKQQKEAEVKKSIGDENFKPTTEESEMKKTPKSEDKRRCIGRKPLTDFVVGKRYTGTIQYIKPSLGLFIDIGCHSDAFCHISRSSDDYVESLESLYKVGDVLSDRVRVVDVDRKKKRITVSLQSDKKIEDEEKSQREYNQRRQTKLEKKKQTSMESKNVATDDFYKNEHTQHIESTESQQGWHHDETPIVIDPETMTPAELKRARKLQRRQERRAAGISA